MKAQRNGGALPAGGTDGRLGARPPAQPGGSHGADDRASNRLTGRILETKLVYWVLFQDLTE